MLADLTIIPVGGDQSTSDLLAQVLKTIEESGVPYQLTPSATCIEGSWDDVVAVARRCHLAAREHSPHVFTMLRIEDDEGAHAKLRTNIESVEQKADEQFHVTPVTHRPVQSVPR